MPRLTHKVITVDNQVFAELRRRAGRESLNTRLRRMLRLSVTAPPHRKRGWQSRISGQEVSAEQFRHDLRQVINHLENFEVELRRDAGRLPALHRVLVNVERAMDEQAVE